MMTQKQRMLLAVRGEMPDVIPFAPRLDLWHNANSTAGTLPKQHKGRNQDEIARAEGWALHKVVPEYDKARDPREDLHRALGLYSLKEFAFSLHFSPNIDIRVNRQGGDTSVEYHTPIGIVSTKTSFTEEMKRAGASLSWIEEHAIKKPEDYRVVGYLFENLELRPQYEDFAQWQKQIGEDGLPVTMVAGGASPVHFIQRDLLDATAFYYHYHDYQKEMMGLAERIEHFFMQALNLISESPAEAVLWGGNFDAMLTYPPYFKKEIVPWIRKASEFLGQKGKFVFCHCDGENLGLMDSIRDSGMHVAESICPHPMTKVKIEEYYEQWSERLTLFGGIPSDLLLKEMTPEDEFDAYLDHLFESVTPGRRLILGVADAVPANAVFERLIRIGERVRKEGPLPLKGRAFRPVTQNALPAMPDPGAKQAPADELYKNIQEDVFRGNCEEIKIHVQGMIREGSRPKTSCNEG